MDCNMPVMDGYESTQQIRAFIEEMNLPQPIISAVTGHSEQSYVRRSILSGMNQVLSKPVDVKVLKFIADQLGYLDQDTSQYIKNNEVG